MRIQTSIAGRPRQLLIVLERDVTASPRIFVALCQPKVNYVDNVLLFAEADQKVVRLYVAMNKAVQMDKLYPLKHLDGQHEHSLQRETTPAVLVEVFE
jgi:hypothetical protein